MDSIHLVQSQALLSLSIKIIKYKELHEARNVAENMPAKAKSWH